MLHSFRKRQFCCLDSSPRSNCLVVQTDHSGSHMMLYHITRSITRCTSESKSIHYNRPNGCTKRARLQSCVFNIDHCRGQIGRHFTFPEPQYRPASFPKPLFLLKVSICVSPQLCLPKFSLGWRQAIVGRTTVPEATVNEDRHSRRWERYIDLYRTDWVLHAKPSATPPECRS